MARERTKPASREEGGTPAKTVRLLLAVLATEGEAFEPEAFSKKLKIPVASLYRYMKALLDAGVLIRPSRGLYLPHPEFLTAVQAFSPRGVLAQVVRPELERLARRVHTTVHFGVLENDMVTYLVKVAEGEDRLFTKEEQQLEAYCSGIGKVLLAELPHDHLEAYLSGGPFPSITSCTITDPDAIREEVIGTGRRGYGVDDREVHDALVCLAVPVRSRRGNILGAVSASSMSLELLGDAHEATLEKLNDAAARLGSFL